MSLLETSRRPASKKKKTRRNAGPASSFFFLVDGCAFFLPSPLSPLFQAGRIPVACLALAPTCGLHAPASVRMRIRNLATRNFADWTQATKFTSLGDQYFFHAGSQRGMVIHRPPMRDRHQTISARACDLPRPAEVKFERPSAARKFLCWLSFLFFCFVHFSFIFGFLLQIATSKK